MAVEKACPVVLRKNRDKWEILAFVHPLAGAQLVKGTIEAKESPSAACQRELYEEAGVAGRCRRLLGRWQKAAHEPIWNFGLMDTEVLPDEWEHFCTDDGGHYFKFFWHPLYKTPDTRWHPLFVDALHFIRMAVERERDPLP